MPDNPVSNEVLLKIVERLEAIEQQMREGFASLTQSQDDLRREQQSLRKDQETMRKELEAMRKDQEVMRKDQEAMRKDQEAMRKELQALNQRMEEGFDKAARERQELNNRFEEFREWLTTELRENASLLFDHILADRQKFESFREEMLKFKKDTEKFQNDSLLFQRDVKQILESVQRTLEKHEQRWLSLEEFVSILHRKFVEFQKERATNDREIQQRLNRLEAA